MTIPFWCVRRPKKTEKIQPLSMIQHEKAVFDLCRKRRNILQELVQTEQTYFSGLTKLLQKFYDPMIHKKLLTETQRIRLAIKIEAMEKFHRVMLVELGRSPNIASVFVKNADFLRMYTDYTNSYTTTLDFVNELRSSKAIR
eukprot:TRINITY_DN5993_c0_g1_i1.p1 TRINITY_DN5993_c0_g1~~TRINITY_DN5993_c0_g1_i1.p1  ORF type:complete len:142 (-),score=21.27 TRINITY_DN5993_c0_g1_i1:64-489(-)